jgi:hypothetical protein
MHRYDEEKADSRNVRHTEGLAGATQSPGRHSQRNVGLRLAQQDQASLSLPAGDQAGHIPVITQRLGLDELGVLIVQRSHWIFAIQRARYWPRNLRP